MAKTIFTTITPLPSNISRETVLSTLHDHLEMIDLNPSHTSRVPSKPPPTATPEEYHCQWYTITDTVSYLPANLITGTVSFSACFHDLANGLQTHCYAPMGLDIKEKWTIGGNAPGEPIAPREIGINAPVEGLYLREDVTMKCNFLLTKFVRKTLQESLKALVARLVVKAQLEEAEERNRRLTMGTYEGGLASPPLSPPLRSPGMGSMNAGVGLGVGVGRAESRASSYSGYSGRSESTMMTPPQSAGYPSEKWIEAQGQRMGMQQQQQQQQGYQPQGGRKSYGGYESGRMPIKENRTSYPGYGNKPEMIAEMEAPGAPVELP
ncbi:Nacht and wd40 domain protein [Rutstroemia sp. NJR-2017a BVV2]|nr:Nacht and wd40 domain protein [Rutstroemia sp. NJR-2017a BVV2]